MHSGTRFHAAIAVLLAVMAGGCATAPGTSPSRQAKVSTLVLTILDIETTGLDSSGDRIIEIGAVKILEGVEREHRHWLVNPGVPIPASAIKIHGIMDKDVRKCAGFRDVFPEVRRFIGNSVILAHNAKFDMEFVRREASRAGLECPDNIVIDTLPLSRNWFPESPRHSLTALAGHFGISHRAMHRALPDIQVLVKLFRMGMEKEKPDFTLGDLIDRAGGDAVRLNGSVSSIPER